MSKLTQSIAILGVVAGLGVAALPLSSYALDPKTQDVPVTLEIKEVLEITTKTGEADETSSPEAVALTQLETVSDDGANYASDGTFNIVVKSNVEKGYTLAIKGSTSITGSGVDGAAVTDLLSSTDRIAAGDLTTASSWGYKVADKTSWTAVTAEDVTVYTASKDKDGDLDIAGGKAFPVTFGANVAASQAAGVYNGKVTFTATANV